MKWHLIHRHEIPNAFDALGKGYEAQTKNLLEENALLEKKAQILELELQQNQIKLIKEQGEKVLESAEIVKLNKDMQKMAMALVIRDSLIKEKLNIELPDPFK
jgi:hypothetical protein